MKNDIKDLKIGNGIDTVYLEMLDKDKVENVYVKLSNGIVNKYERGTVSYEDFNKEILDGFALMGINDDSKGKELKFCLVGKVPTEIVNAVKEREPELDFTIAESGVSNVKFSKTLTRVAGYGVVASLVIGGVAGAISYPEELKKCLSSLTGLFTKSVEEEVDSSNLTTIDETIKNATEVNTVVENTESLQNQFKEENLDFLLNYNKSEDWMYSKLSEEDIEYFEKIGLEITGDEVIFGYTAEELSTFRIAYGRYSKEDLVSIMGGEHMDVTTMFNSSDSPLDRFLRKTQIAYLYTDKENLDVVNLAGFNEEELDRIHRYEKYLFDYKNLIKDGKYKEAEELMHEIKQDIVEYGFASNENQELAKTYILSTLLKTFEFYSKMMAYKGDVTLHVFNSVTNKSSEVTVKMDLFDPYTMVRLIEGLYNCIEGNGVLSNSEEAEILKLAGLDPKTNSIQFDNDGISKFDQLYERNVSLARDYNDYVTNLRSENAAADQATTINSINTIENNSAYDALINNTVEYQKMIDSINEELKAAGLFPINDSALMVKWAESMTEQYDIINGNVTTTTATVTQGNGTYVVTPITKTRTETHTERISYKQAVSAEEQAREEAANKAAAIEAARQIYVIDQDTGERKKADAQDYINNVWNKGAMQNNNLPTNLTGDFSADLSDPVAKRAEELAQKAVTDNVDANKAAAEGSKSSTSDGSINTYTSGGDEHIDEKYKNADTASNDYANAYNDRLSANGSGNTANSDSAPAADSQPANEAPQGLSSYEDASSAVGFGAAVESLPDIMEDDTDNLDAAIETGSSIRRI